MKDRTLESKGRIADHLGISVRKLDESIAWGEAHGGRKRPAP